MRSVLGQYRSDRGKGPESLEELVKEGYLQVLPADPFTNSRASWRVVRAAPAPGRADRPVVVDVHSGATGKAADGTPYSSW